MTSPLPTKMSEEEARQFIEQNLPQYNRILDARTRSKALAEEGRRQVEQLLKTAEEKLGTRDEAEIQRLLEDRKLTNGQRVKDWLDSLAACQKESENLSRPAAPAR